MDYEDLLLEKKEGIATITLNAPERLNALSGKMTNSMSLAVDEIAKDDEVKVVIVTGAGRGFCAGADTSAIRDLSEGTARRSRYDQFHRLGQGPHSLIRLHKPVIGAINGVAAGAGFGLALSCDIRIASEAARFVVSQTNLGLMPDGGLTYLLPLAVGTSKALEIMFTGDTISAAEAERVGIVSRVVPPDELMKVSQELAAKIAQKSPISLGLIKRVEYETLSSEMPHYLDLEAYGQNWCARTEEHRAALRAFAERRQRPQEK